MSRHPGFFDMDERLKRLSDLGDQLEAFAAAVDFEMFRPTLDTVLAYAACPGWLRKQIPRHRHTASTAD